MKLFVENIIKIIFCKCPCRLAKKKRLVLEYSNTSLYASTISCWGVDNGRGNFLSFADQYGPGTIIKLLL